MQSYTTDASYVVQCSMAVIERAKCPSCGQVIKAPNPFLDGTSLGPILLSVILMMFKEANTDKGIANILHDIFGFEPSSNAIRNAKKRNFHIHAGRHACPDNAMIRLRPHIQADETSTDAVASTGYVWVIYTRLLQHLSSSHRPGLPLYYPSTLHDLKASLPHVMDTPGYPELTDIIQWDFIHTLQVRKSVGDKQKTQRRGKIRPTIVLYRDAKKIKTLASYRVHIHAAGIHNWRII